MQHPSAEMSHFNTCVEQLKAGGVTYDGYMLGMLLPNALLPKWDHVAAIICMVKPITQQSIIPLSEMPLWQSMTGQVPLLVLLSMCTRLVL